METDNTARLKEVKESKGVAIRAKVVCEWWKGWKGKKTEWGEGELRKEKEREKKRMPVKHPTEDCIDKI